MKALLLEDDKDQADLVSATLSAAGYECDTVANGNEGARLLLSRPYSLAIVDVVVPGIDGLEVIRRAREAGCDIPMIVLSSRNSNEDILSGYGVQADAYITKPCSMSVLRASVTAVMRRMKRTLVNDVAECGGVILNRRTRAVTRDGRKVALSAYEFNLLELPMSNRGSVVTYEQIRAEMWPEHRTASNHNIAQVVDSLRTRLSGDGDRCVIIENKRGAGYVVW